MSPTLQLSPFQKEKLASYFKFFEPNEQGILESHSIDRVMERIYKYTSWAKDNPRALQCFEIHAAFFEILFEKAEEEGGKPGTATLQDWYAIWSHILPGVKGMSTLPVWLRLMPKVLFQMMDRDADNLIDQPELENFYNHMLDLKIPENDFATMASQAYSQMTDDGRYPLNLDSYEQIFANFLLGRTPHGPGKYIFGCFKHDAGHFQLIQPMEDSDGEGRTGITIINEKRPKKFGIAFT